jgi:uncharacterized protein (TIGR00375 family)
VKFIADFHIHSKYSRACSKQLDLEHISAWSRIKGINIVACADFTHPKWYAELFEKLEETREGLYELKKEYRVLGDDVVREFSPVLISAPQYFILATEISCIYSKDKKVRRVHLIVCAPSLPIVAKINTMLATIGNLSADGRPILGIDVRDLVARIRDISDECFFIPAHAWTPWFSVFGSFSGFNTLEECFGDMTPYISAIETGLSSDPKMNWRLSGLNRITLVSNSDAHSLEKLGREANIFSGATLSYPTLCSALRAPGTGGSGLSFEATIEFFPEEGKYHLDGHRLCKFSCEPARTAQLGGICPACKKPLTVGVLNRVAKLSDQDADTQKNSRIPFFSIIPLQEIISQVIGVGVQSKAVRGMYKKVINRCGSEFDILLNVPTEELEKNCSSQIADALTAMRRGEIEISPGYDGEYGTIHVKKMKSEKQKELF